MNIDECVKLHNKPFAEMQLEELYAEQMVRKWHRARMKYHKGLLVKKQWWIEQNKPIEDKDELRRLYEDGDIPISEYRIRMMNRGHAIKIRMRHEDYMKFCDRLIYADEAIIDYTVELIDRKKAEKADKMSAEKSQKKRKAQGRKKYDPRRAETKYNTLDPSRRWKTRGQYNELPSLRKARARIRQADKVPTTISRRLQPILQWDVDKLRQIARDRGYYTDVAMTVMIAEHLRISATGAEKLLSIGKLSWSQCILIGALFEMTPKEFCDVFLSGYFREVTDGVFKAYVEDPEELLDMPYQAQARKNEETTDAE